ncbi:MAG: NAD(P)H-binding protein [Mycobacterium sp.]
MKVVVFGAGGFIGTKVVDMLTREGEQVVAASRRSGVDVLTGAGLAKALAGADAVVDATNAPSFDPDELREFFNKGTTNMVTAAKHAGVKHFVELSIVGTDGLPDSPYLSAKAAQERVITRSVLPYTIVRATQFHEFAGTIVDSLTDGDDVRVPDALIQPIAGDEVAAFLAEVAVEAPRNHVVNIGGPEKLSFADLARAVVARRHGEQSVAVDANARYFGARLRQDSLVTEPGAMLGSIEF